MKTITTITKIVLPILLLAAPFSASAHDASAGETCSSKSEALEHVEYVDDLIMEADFGARRNSEKDRNGLHIKAMNALLKLESYKLDQAGDKLEDIYEKVYALDNSPKSKIDSDDAGYIIEAVADATDCIGGM